MRKTARTAVAAATVALFAAGVGDCSNPGGGTAPSRSRTPAPRTGTATPAGARLTIKDFTFRPANLSVRPGATVTAVNEDSTTHTVTAGGARLFDTGSIKPGRTATFRAPGRAGRYTYTCTIHPYMKATLTVR
ncbi:cupredoxin domain-containing protein [Streptomyces angustmyceticus]|uniref:cupredoxin domain-containing protein n=1 Tax=Streptomyces angustmyceticus TaxID=285578 RepID=UPI00344FE299